MPRPTRPISSKEIEVTVVGKPATVFVNFLDRTFEFTESQIQTTSGGGDTVTQSVEEKLPRFKITAGNQDAEFDVYDETGAVVDRISLKDVYNILYSMTFRAAQL